MQINSVSQSDVNAASAKVRPTTRTAPEAEPKIAASDTGASQELSRAMDAVPDVRAEAVARGRELYQQVAYPPTEIVNGISRLIARFWEGA